MEAELKSCAPYSLAIKTPIPIKIESATLISEQLTIYQTKECLYADKNIILYFNDFVGTYEMDRLARGLEPKITLCVISWIAESELCHIEPPFWHCKYVVDEQKEYYLDTINYETSCISKENFL